MSEKPKNENLQRQCRPNENANASGSPNQLPISSLYAELARRVVPEKLKMELHLEGVATYGEAVAMVVFNDALKGKVAAVREIRESIEGRANQRPKPVGAGKFEVIVSYEEPPLLKMLPQDSSDSTNE